MVKKYSDLYLDARKALLPGEGQQRAGLLARELLCAASGKSQEEILSRRDQYAPEEVCRTMEDFTGRALAGEPLAYILEEWDFYGMTLYVNRDGNYKADSEYIPFSLNHRQKYWLQIPWFQA